MTSWVCKATTQKSNTLTSQYSVRCIFSSVYTRSLSELWTALLARRFALDLPVGLKMDQWHSRQWSCHWIVSIWCHAFIPFSLPLHSECLLVAINWICVFRFVPLVHLLWHPPHPPMFLKRFNSPKFCEHVLCFCLLMGLTSPKHVDVFHTTKVWIVARCAFEKNGAHLFSLLSIWLHK